MLIAVAPLTGSQAGLSSYKARTHLVDSALADKWIPAFAGMTTS